MMRDLALEPCPLCGNPEPEIDYGLDGAPYPNGPLISCPTVWTPDQLGVDWLCGCPMHAENPKVWNAISQSARSDALIKAVDALRDGMPT